MGKKKAPKGGKKLREKGIRYIKGGGVGPRDGTHATDEHERQKNTESGAQMQATILALKG